jgi:hypothetical protein
MNENLSSQPAFDALPVHAAWEPSDDVMCCRWFVAWKLLGKNQIAGAIAGYAGGSEFVVEQFWGELEGGKFTKCWVDYTDRITDEEIDFSSLPDDVTAVCERASTLMWEWNDLDKWDELDSVYLRLEHKGKLVAKRGMWRLEAGHFQGIRELCEYAGLMAAPLA